MKAEEIRERPLHAGREFVQRHGDTLRAGAASGETAAMTEPRAVQVTSADFNGRTFDGCPFSSVPDWLGTALEEHAITIHPAERDYALWRVGNVIAAPGDWIVLGEDGELSVRPHAEGPPT